MRQPEIRIEDEALDHHSRKKLWEIQKQYPENLRLQRMAMISLLNGQIYERSASNYKEPKPTPQSFDATPSRDLRPEEFMDSEKLMELRLPQKLWEWLCRHERIIDEKIPDPERAARAKNFLRKSVLRDEANIDVNHV